MGAIVLGVSAEGACRAWASPWCRMTCLCHWYYRRPTPSPRFVTVSESPSPVSKPAHIPSLTALRGLAALAVVLHHYEQLLPLPGGGEGLFSKAYLMVDLFFALSGFVMIHVYGECFSETVGRKSFTKYMRGRFARIYPLHFFVTTVLVCLVAWGQSQSALPDSGSFATQFDYDALPWVYTLTHAWGVFLSPTWNDPSWSISVEWALYLVFPFMALAVARHRRHASMALATVGLAALLYVVYVAQPTWAAQMSSTHPIEPHTLNIATGFALLRGVASFSLGIFAYQLYQARFLADVLKSDALCALTALLVVVNTLSGALPDLVSVLLFPLLILQTSYAEGWVMRVMKAPILDLLGRLSYSIYLTHGPLLLVCVFLITSSGAEGVAQHLTPWSALLGVLTLSFLLSAATHYLIEVPARRWLRPRS